MGKINLGRVKGSTWYTGTSYDDIKALEGDMFLDTTTKIIYQYTNNKWIEKSEIPTKVSQLENDNNFIIEQELFDSLKKINDKPVISINDELLKIEEEYDVFNKGVWKFKYGESPEFNVPDGSYQVNFKDSLGNEYKNIYLKSIETNEGVYKYLVKGQYIDDDSSYIGNLPILFDSTDPAYQKDDFYIEFLDGKPFFETELKKITNKYVKLKYITAEYVDEQINKTNDLIKDISNKNGIIYLDLTDIFNNTMEALNITIADFYNNYLSEHITIGTNFKIELTNKYYINIFADNNSLTISKDTVNGLWMMKNIPLNSTMTFYELKTLIRTNNDYIVLTKNEMNKISDTIYIETNEITIFSTLQEIVDYLLNAGYDLIKECHFYIKPYASALNLALNDVWIYKDSTRCYFRSIINYYDNFKMAYTEDMTQTLSDFLNSHKPIATEKYVDTKVADLVNSAPETLDTLGELANALQENGDIVDTLNNAIGNKADKSYVLEQVDIKNKSLRSQIIIVNNEIYEIEEKTDNLAYGIWKFKYGESEDFGGFGSNYGLQIDCKDNLGNEYDGIYFYSTETENGLYKYTVKGKKGSSEIILFDSTDETYQKDDFYIEFLEYSPYKNWIDIIEFVANKYIKFKIDFNSLTNKPTQLSELANDEKFLSKIIIEKNPTTLTDGKWAFRNGNLKEDVNSIWTVTGIKDSLGNDFEKFKFAYIKENDYDEIIGVKVTGWINNVEYVIYNSEQKNGYAFENGELKDDYYLTFNLSSSFISDDFLKIMYKYKDNEDIVTKEYVDEKIANAGGGASGDYVPVKTRYDVPDNTFNLSGNQDSDFNVEANLGDISNKVLYWDWQREQAIYDPQLGGTIADIVIDLTNGTYTYGNKNFTLYIYFEKNNNWIPNINSDTGFTISLPAMWTWQIDGVLGNTGGTEIMLEGAVDHTCNPNGDGNYMWFYMPNITDFSGNITFRIDVDNEGFATFTILKDYVY